MYQSLMQNLILKVDSPDIWRGKLLKMKEEKGSSWVDEISN